MNLGTAIVQTHDRKDFERRNHLIRVALANGSSYRRIARLLRWSVGTVYSYVGGVERPDPLKRPLSEFDDLSTSPRATETDIERVALRLAERDHGGPLDGPVCAGYRDEAETLLSLVFGEGGRP